MKTNLASKIATKPTWGSTCRFLWFFSNLAFDLEIRFNGVLDMENTNIAIKKSYDVLLRVYTSIFVNFSNLPFDLEIGFNGVFRHGEHEYRNKNRMMYSWGSTRRFLEKIQNCPSTLKLSMWGFKVSGTPIWPWKNPPVYTGGFHEFFILVAWPWNSVLCNFLEFLLDDLQRWFFYV